MDDCCEDKASELAVIQARHERVLWVVLLVNALMFFVEFGAGVLSGSSALLADSLDMDANFARVRELASEPAPAEEAL